MNLNSFLTDLYVTIDDWRRSCTNDAAPADGDDPVGLLAGRRWHLPRRGDHPELLEHPELVELDPGLHDLAVRDAIDVDAAYHQLFARRGELHELACVRRTAGPAGHHRVAFGDLILDVDASVWKAAP